MDVLRVTGARQAVPVVLFWAGVVAAATGGLAGLVSGAASERVVVPALAVAAVAAMYLVQMWALLDVFGTETAGKGGLGDQAFWMSPRYMKAAALNVPRVLDPRLLGEAASVLRVPVAVPAAAVVASGGLAVWAVRSLPA